MKLRRLCAGHALGRGRKGRREGGRGGRREREDDEGEGKKGREEGGEEEMCNRAKFFAELTH